MNLKYYIDITKYIEILHLTKHEILFCLAYFALALIICHYSTPYGPRMFADSPGYIAIGEEIQDNIEYLFKVSSPPMYSILIALGINIGLEPLQSAGIVPCLCLALLAFPLFILGKIISNPVTSYITCGICLISTSLLNISTYALTDTPYLFFSTIAIVFLAIYNKKNKINKFPIILLAGAFSSLAFMTRYIGISLIILGLITISISNNKPKLYHLITYCIMSILPVIYIMFPSTNKIPLYEIGYNSINPPIAQSLSTLAFVFNDIFFLKSKPNIIIYFILLLFIVSLIGIIEKKRFKSFSCNIEVIVAYLIIYCVFLVLVTSSSVIGITGGVLDARKVVQIFPFAVLLIGSSCAFFYNIIKGRNSKIIWKYIISFLLFLFFIQQSVALIDYANYLRHDTDFYQNWNSIREFDKNNNVTFSDKIIADKLYVAPLLFYQHVDFKTNKAKIIYYSLKNNKITYDGHVNGIFDNVSNDTHGNVYLYVYGNRPELIESHSFRDIIVRKVFNNSYFIIYKMERIKTLSNLTTYQDSITTYIEFLSLINDGRILETRGNLVDSLKLYERALELDPNDRNVWIAKGRVLNQLGKYNESIKAYDEAIYIDPKDAEAWYSKGYIYHRQAKYDQAIQAYDTAIDIDPENSKSWTMKGSILEGEHNYEEALKSYIRVLELDPNNKNVWIAKGRVLCQLGNYNESIKAYNEAIELDPNDKNIHKPNPRLCAN